MKNILITGISSGIGRYLAATLPKHGYRVIGTLRKEADRLNVIQEQPNLSVVIMDLENGDSIQEAFKEINTLVEGNGLFALINNAGIAVPGPLSELPLSRFRQQLETNLIGLLDCTQRCIPLLLHHAGERRILNMSSVSGLIASPFIGAYACSKFGLEALSDALRRELVFLGIKVVIIEPGPFKTAIWRKNLGVKDAFPNSLFSQFIQKAEGIILNSEANAFELPIILPSVIKALESNRPQNRYLVHKSPKKLKFAAYFLPSKWLDKMIHKNLISGKNKIRPV
ncbi:MAG: SDR family NAD(P)-dependent oxidoreductase [Bacteroidota bacterium]|nr:SDR family NAD(P)-dependent oxidoreductase [Bacteroidota bacterium]